jgi:hypothetical protein
MYSAPEVVGAGEGLVSPPGVDCEFYAGRHYPLSPKPMCCGSPQHVMTRSIKSPTPHVLPSGLQPATNKLINCGKRQGMCTADVLPVCTHSGCRTQAS